MQPPEEIAFYILRCVLSDVAWKNYNAASALS